MAESFRHKRHFRHLRNYEWSIDFQGEGMLEAIPADFLRRLKMCPQEVRRIEVMRLSGDKANPHNRMKKNWLCGFIV